jgi:hypothetical protein
VRAAAGALQQETARAAAATVGGLHLLKHFKGQLQNTLTLLLQFVDP